MHLRVFFLISSPVPRKRLIDVLVSLRFDVGRSHVVDHGDRVWYCFWRPLRAFRAYLLVAPRRSPSVSTYDIAVRWTSYCFLMSTVPRVISLCTSVAPTSAWFFWGLPLFCLVVPGQWLLSVPRELRIYPVLATVCLIWTPRNSDGILWGLHWAGAQCW